MIVLICAYWCFINTESIWGNPSKVASIIAPSASKNYSFSILFNVQLCQAKLIKFIIREQNTLLILT